MVEPCPSPFPSFTRMMIEKKTIIEVVEEIAGTSSCVWSLNMGMKIKSSTRIKLC
jgi:hypothetical protein